MTAGWLPTCGSGRRYGLWYNRLPLPEFAYLFFWFAWPETFLQIIMACTSSSDCHDLVLGSKSLPKLGSWTQQQKRTAVGQHGGGGGSGMGLWELSLGSGTVKIADRSFICSSDFWGMHRNSWRLLGLWAETQHMTVWEVGGGEVRRWKLGRWEGGMGLWKRNFSDWVCLHLDVRST